MISFKQYLEEESKCNCWKGYKRKPGTKPCAEGSCIKEETIHVGYRNSKGDWIKTSSHANYPAAKTAMDDLKKAGKKGVQHRYDNAGSIDPGMRTLSHEETFNDDDLLEAAVDAKGHKSSTGGLTQKGRDAYNNKTGSNLKAPVTTKPSKLDPDSKAAKRRKSFCARMGGVDGPMKKPNGEPTRKALALRKWNC